MAPPPTESRRQVTESQFWDKTYRKVSANLEPPLPNSGEACFRRRLRDPKGKAVLSIGGGIDTLAIDLSEAGAQVLSIDVSAVAVEQTTALAWEHQVSDRLTCRRLACEAVDFVGEFDW